MSPKTLVAAMALTVCTTDFVYADGKDAGHAAEGSTFSFALIGDLPYSNAPNDVKFRNLMDEINESRLSFVVHDGDFKNGSSLCSDEVFAQRYDLFNRFVHPFVFIFGDNEWTDCHRANNGGYDPLERLQRLRAMFTAGNTSLGEERMTLERQSEDAAYSPFRENIRWVRGDVLFVGLHIVGSNNNRGRTAEADAEYAARNAANLAWLTGSFGHAKQNNYRAIMLIMQANPAFELAEGNAMRTGFDDILAALRSETVGFEKPVVLVHGDSHYFRIDKPMYDQTGKRVENFTRVETFGSKDVHWVKGTVDPRNPNIFRFEQKIVAKNDEAR